jgi:hypothetical protein
MVRYYGFVGYGSGNAIRIYVRDVEMLGKVLAKGRDQPGGAFIVGDEGFERSKGN